MEEKVQKDVEMIEGMLKPGNLTKGVQTYEVGKRDSRKLFKSKGIDEKTLKNVSEACNDIINAAMKIASNKLEKSNDDVINTKVKISTDLGNYVAVASKKIYKKKNPQTGEEIIKKGSMTLKCVIKPMIRKDLMKECLSQIEKVAKL